MNRVLILMSVLLQSLALASERGHTLQIRAELGPVWQSSNQVQIPGTTGTRFDFTSLGAGPAFQYRLDGTWRVGENSEIRALYAPLVLNITGRLNQTVDFQNSTFSSSVDTAGLYRFNSYRLTYRYRFIDSERFQLWAGITGKVRDAEIRLTQGGTVASRTDLGFVPLLNLKMEYYFSSDFALILDADALAAPQGRAEDIGLLLKARVSPHFEVLGGHRTLEGGSSGGGNVYNFTWLNYGILGVSYELLPKNTEAKE